MYIDFDKGTRAQQAQSIRKKIVATSAKVTDSAMDEVIKTGRSRNARTEVKPSTLRHMNKLRQFHIGQFELGVDGADLSCLKNNVEDRMPLTKTMAQAPPLTSSVNLRWVKM